MSMVDLHRPFHPWSFDGSRRKLSPAAVTAVRGEKISGIAWWTMLVCSGVALVTSTYLAWASLTSSSVAGCGGGNVFDCDHVLHSRWSTVLSIPVSIPAIVTHAVIFSMLLARPVTSRLQQIRWATIGFASLAAGAAAVWFIGLQVFWIQQLCPYCLVAHTSGLLLAIVFLWKHPIEKRTIKWIGGGAAVSLAGLIALQSLNSVPPTYEVIDYTDASDPSTASSAEEEFLFEAPTDATDTQASLTRETVQRSLIEARTVIFAFINPATLLSGEVNANGTQGTARTARVLNNIKLDTTQWPLLGKPDAELVFVELFDYTCEHCQRTHTALEGARQKFGDRLAVITLPVPLDRKCNSTVTSTHASHSEACEIAKLAIAVWILDHSKFGEFHHYLFAAKPSYAQAKAKASTIVDGSRLQQTLNGSMPSDYIAKHVALYQKAGGGTIPKLMFPQTTTVGAVESADSMIRLIEQYVR